MLTRETFAGPWAGLPVTWTEQDELDEQTYRADVARCCQAGVPGVYTGGTTGEFYAVDFAEFQAIARATVEECRAHGTPAMIGCTATYTRAAIQRAAYAAELGADAIQVALPFWMEIHETDIVPFFQNVADAAEGVALSIYETLRAKRALSLDEHRRIHDVIPNYLMVKANAGTVGCTADGCEALSDIVNVFVGEGLWDSLGRRGANGCCSAMVYWNPRIVLALWRDLGQKRWDNVDTVCGKIRALHAFLAATYAPKGFTDTAYDRMGGRATGFLGTSLRSRAPYPSATAEDVTRLQQWYEANWPEMLQL